MNAGSKRFHNGNGATSWLPILEKELRRRVGWVDELVSPFARSEPQPGAKAPVHLVSADTLLFSTGDRKSA
jgi:hypothetical protein